MTIKLNAATGGGSVSLSAPNSTTSNLDVELTLPVDDGAADTFLKSDGSGTLSWAAASSDNITEGNTTAEVVDTGSDGHFKVTTEGTERLRVDSSGRLGIGTSSPRLRTHILGDAANFPTLGVASGSLIVGPSDRDYGMMFGVSSSGLGWIQAQNFITTGAAYNLHLQPSGGFVKIGTPVSPSGAASSTGFSFMEGSNFTWSTNGGNAYWNASTDTYLNFRRNGTQVGNINWSSSSTAFVTSSDYRMKENIVVLDGAIDRVKQLLPKRFNFIVTPDKTVDGFLAHEAQTVVPEAVTGVKDELQVWLADEELPEGVSVGDLKLDDDGNPLPKYQGIDQAKLVPLLTAALQEAIAKIETLETANASLEARLTALEGGAS